MDVNFDGFADLLLSVSQGARNDFVAVALWNSAAGCFDPVLQTRAWNAELGTFDEQPSQLVLVNAQLLPEQNAVLSAEEDGFRYRVDTLYLWGAGNTIAPRAVASRYNAGADQIGEQLWLLGDTPVLCWDMAYPEAWYYADNTNVTNERTASLQTLMLGMQAQCAIANVDTAQLYQQDSETSPVLANLTAGTSVWVLAQGCGQDGSWVRVWLPQDGSAGLTGYLRSDCVQPAA